MAPPGAYPPPFGFPGMSCIATYYIHAHYCIDQQANNPLLRSTRSTPSPSVRNASSGRTRRTGHASSYVTPIPVQTKPTPESIYLTSMKTAPGARGLPFPPPFPGPAGAAPPAGLPPLPNMPPGAQGFPPPPGGFPPNFPTPPPGAAAAGFPPIPPPGQAPAGYSPSPTPGIAGPPGQDGGYAPPPGMGAGLPGPPPGLGDKR